MSLSLPSQASQFVFQFPQSFVPHHIEDRYKSILEEMHSPYDSVLDYLNACIRSINFPGMDFGQSTQTIMRGKQIDYKPATNVHDTFGRELTVTMENVDANLSYFIMMDLMIYHYLDTSKPHIDSFIMYVLNIGRRMIYTTFFDRLIVSNVSDYTFDFADYQLQDSTFTVGFKYNFIEMKYLPIPESLIELSQNPSNLEQYIISQGLRPSKRTYKPNS